MDKEGKGESASPQPVCFVSNQAYLWEKWPTNIPDLFLCVSRGS